VAHETGSHPETVGRGRRVLLFTVTLAIAPLLLASVEFALRIGGFGWDDRLFVEAPGRPGDLEANPHVIRRYHGASTAVAAAIPPIAFAADRAEGVYRIVVQGGSTAEGFPYGRWGGLAGMLGDRLEAAFPDREVEVITTAMAAVNSFTVLDLVDEIIEIEPDAVLIYAGHNEYLGVLGVGSALVGGYPRSLTQALIALRHFRIFQLTAQVVHNISAPARAAENDRETLFTRAAQGSVVPFGSDGYKQGLDQFEANLGETLERYRDAGVPVYLGTIAANERDQPPFVGEPRTEDFREDWDRRKAAVLTAIAVGDERSTDAAIAHWESLDPSTADPVFERARFEERRGAFEAARESYRRARDLDALRFRAPAAVNASIRALAAHYGATLVDVERAMLEASPNGLLGKSLFLEHVHPNAAGYFLLADAYYDAIRRDGRIGDWKDAPTKEEARRDMPITAIDRAIAAYDVAELTGGFPFGTRTEPFTLPAPRNEIERIAQALRRGEVSWLDSMESLMQLHLSNGQEAEAAVVARVVAQAYPTLYAPNYVAGTLLLARGEPRRAQRYLVRSLRAAPGDREALAALVRSSLALGSEEELEQAVANLAQVDPTHRLVREYRNSRKVH